MNFDSLSGLKAKKGFWILNLSGLGYLRVPLFVMFWVVMILILMIIFYALPLVLVYGMLGILAVLTVYVAITRSRTVSRVFQQFAEDNNWQVGGVPEFGKVFKKLNFDTKRAYLNGTLATRPSWLYETGPVNIGSMKSEFMQDMLVLTVKLPKKTPIIALTQSQGSLNTLSDHHFVDMVGLSKLSLEGDFDKHLLIYSEAEATSAPLEYITPDVMMVLKNDTHSIIVYDGDYLSVATAKGLKKESIQKLFHDMDLILKEVRHKQKF